MSKREAFCPWELKGRVMRTLITENGPERLELLDGVKFFTDKGWALVLPDADKPMFRVYSEGETPEMAETISDKYLDRIKSIIDISNKQVI
ncbi:MAG: hypothetical protein ACOX7R_11475 [Acetivibrionales bacterium]